MAVPTDFPKTSIASRSSPFRRPVSPASSATLRQSTSPVSPSKVGGAHGPSRLGNATPELGRPRGFAQTAEMNSPHLGSPAHISARQTKQAGNSGNALSQLQPTQVRTLRDGFQILDRDSDGVVNREDVIDMLTQLGLPASQAEATRFFPPSGPQTMTLAIFLNSIASTLVAMSPNKELLSAFSAFDDDDSGQVDLGELRDAVLNTAPEPGEKALSPAAVDKIMAGFSGRRAFSKSMAGGLGKRGEVFKYPDFVNSIVGSNGTSEPPSNEGSEN